MINPKNLSIIFENHIFLQTGCDKIKGMGQKLTTFLLFSYFVTSCDLNEKVTKKKTSQAEDDPMSGTAATLGMMVFGYGCACVQLF